MGKTFTPDLHFFCDFVKLRTGGEYQYEKKIENLSAHVFFLFRNSCDSYGACDGALHLNISGDYGTGGDHERESSGHGEK